MSQTLFTCILARRYKCIHLSKPKSVLNHSVSWFTPSSGFEEIKAVIFNMTTNFYMEKLEMRNRCKSEKIQDV